MILDVCENCYIDLKLATVIDNEKLFNVYFSFFSQI